ncbi:MAG: hypothetical protein Kilf2KO_40290 [Rhodospirillales bacterium]
MRLTRGLTAALGSLAFLTACASLIPGAAVIGPNDLQRYTAQSNALFVGNGQLVLIGTTTNPADRTALSQVAATNVAQGAFGTKFQLTPRDQAERPSRNRVVMAIGGADTRRLCTEPPDRGGNFSGGSIRVGAAACNGDTRLSSVSGQIDGLSGVDDPKLANFFGQIGAALFPGRNLDYQQRDRDWGF